MWRQGRCRFDEHVTSLSLSPLRNVSAANLGLIPRAVNRKEPKQNEKMALPAGGFEWQICSSVSLWASLSLDFSRFLGPAGIGGAWLWIDAGSKAHEERGLEQAVGPARVPEYDSSHEVS